MKTLEEMTVEELKILGYDQMKQFQMIQQNLQLIELELQKREKIVNETKGKDK